MSDDLTMYLSSGGRHATLSPERLEMMGKEAANLLLEKKVPLNKSITKMAAAHPDVNAEQVKRIAEFANTAVYLAQHDKNKTASADSSYPQFELADARLILKGLSADSVPTKVASADVDYARQPGKSKTASAKLTERLDSELETLFGYSKEKTASAGDLSDESKVHEVVTTKENLRSLKEHLEFVGERFDLNHKQASAEYYDSVKRHLLDGGSFADVMAAARSTDVGDEKIAEVVAPMIEQLIKEKVASPNRLQAQIRELEKVAHRVVNQDHEFVTLFGAVVGLQTEVEKVAYALEDVDTQLKVVNDFIRETYLAR